MNTIYILRGISGSGKSTLAQKTASDRCKRGLGPAYICSADAYFVNAEGVYIFKPEQLAHAHGSCMRNVIDAMHARIPTIIVDNTNIRHKEFIPYIQLAQIGGYEVQLLAFPPPEVGSVSFQTEVRRCHRANVHGVPLESIERQAANYERGTPNV